MANKRFGWVVWTRDGYGVVRVEDLDVFFHARKRVGRKDVLPVAGAAVKLFYRAHPRQEGCYQATSWRMIAYYPKELRRARSARRNGRSSVVQLQLHRRSA
jgi:hypothetical protein